MQTVNYGKNCKFCGSIVLVWPSLSSKVSIERLPIVKKLIFMCDRNWIILFRRHRPIQVRTMTIMDMAIRRHRKRLRVHRRQKVRITFYDAEPIPKRYIFTPEFVMLTDFEDVNLVHPSCRMASFI